MTPDVVLALLQTESPDVQRLAAVLNEMIQKDFGALVQLLYRVDVPEKEVTRTLRLEPHADAGLLLAHLLINRQKEKQKQKTGFLSPPDITDADRW